jgi:DNA-binding transcriptional regulator YiaG
MKNKYQSEALQVVHEDMKGMYELGIISEEKMKEYDKMCLVQEPETAYEDKRENSTAMKHLTV